MRAQLKEIQDFILERGLPTFDLQTKCLVRSELQVSEDVLEEFFGCGPLKEFFLEPNVSEILINGFNEIWVEVFGKLTKTESSFSSEESLRRFVRRILSSAGKKIDQANPFADLILEDGSRAHIVSAPAYKAGICISIRKFKKEGWTIKDLEAQGFLCEQSKQFLLKSISDRKNIFICGGTGTGKTSLLGALISETPEQERVIAIEDVGEIFSSHPHFIGLETRMENQEGEGEITIRRLIRESLRMRPDRLVVGECRGGEALDLLMALNTGHKGSMATIHANSTRDALQRLETLALLSSENLNHNAVRAMIASCVHVVVHIERSDRRRINSIAEVRGVDAENYLLREQKFF